MRYGPGIVGGQQVFYLLKLIQVATRIYLEIYFTSNYFPKCLLFEVSIVECTESKLSLNHVLHEVLRYPENSPISYAFTEFGINDINDFLTIHPLQDLKDVAFTHSHSENETKEIQATLTVAKWFLFHYQILQYLEIYN